MPPNKDRLYIALFAHSRPDAYHWAFLVSPKENSNSNYQTIQYHATNRIQLRDGMMKATWELERVQLGKSEPVRLLARILIGKVERSRDELDKSLESVAVVQDDPNWRCRTWAEHALTQLGKDKILTSTSVTDWTVVEAGCLAYVQKKREEGRYCSSMVPTAPVYDLMAKKELAS